MSIGNQYLLEENYKEAISAFEKAKNTDSKSTEAIIGMAKAYIGINDIDNAADNLKNAQSLDMKNEKLNLEILNIISKIDQNTANELLKNFLDKIGIENVSESFRANILEKTNKKDLNTYIEKAKELHDKAVEGSEEGNYKSGSKATLSSVIEEANKIKGNYFVSQDNVDTMLNNLKQAIEDFEGNKVKAMPSNLANTYISRLKKIESETDIKMSQYEYLSNAELGGVLYDAQLQYEGLINEIYNDLERYLSNEEKSKLTTDKNSYKKEKEQMDYDFNHLEPGMVGTYLTQAIPESFGNLAKDHCYYLIYKYMN